MTDSLKTLHHIKTKRLDKASRVLNGARRDLAQKQHELEQARQDWRVSCDQEQEKNQLLIQAARQGISRQALDLMRWEVQQRRIEAIKKHDVMLRSESSREQAEQVCEYAQYDLKQKATQLEKVGHFHAQHLRLIQRQKEQREEIAIEENFQQRYLTVMSSKRKQIYE
jgi:hypothetical protein